MTSGCLSTPPLPPSGDFSGAAEEPDWSRSRAGVWQGRSKAGQEQDPEERQGRREQGKRRPEAEQGRSRRRAGAKWVLGSSRAGRQQE